MHNPGIGPVAHEVRDALSKAANAVAEACMHIRQEDPPNLEAIQETFRPILMLEGRFYADSIIGGAPG